MQDFIDVIKQHGLAKNNRFRVDFNIPSQVLEYAGQQQETSGFTKFVRIMAGSPTASRTMSIMVEGTNLPGYSLNTIDQKYNSDPESFVYSASYESHVFTFLCSRDFYEKRVIDYWIEYIFSKTNHSSKYKDEYVTNIVINQLDEYDNVVYAVKLIDAYPQRTNQMEVSSSYVNTFHRFTAGFKYKRWVRVDSKEDTELNALQQTVLGPYITEALGNPWVRKGLDYLKTQGIDLEGDALDIYNQINDVVNNSSGLSINKITSILNNINASIANNTRLTSAQQTELSGIIAGAINSITG